MQRSGTSLVAGLLAQLGLFIGARTDANNESPLILALERDLLRWAGGSWQEPEALAALLAQPAARSHATGSLHHALASPRSLRYLGPALLALSQPRRPPRALGLEIAGQHRHAAAVAGAVP